MTRVYITDARSEERYALRLLLTDINLEVVGESDNWIATLTQAPQIRADMFVVDWDLLPNRADTALKDLRKACPTALIMVIFDHLNAHQRAELSAEVNMFISKSEAPERIANRLRFAVVKANPNRNLSDS